jgi:hypothetical protein
MSNYQKRESSCRAEEERHLPFDSGRAAVFAGKVLEDGPTLADYSVQKESTLDRVLKLTAPAEPHACELEEVSRAQRWHCHWQRTGPT